MRRIKRLISILVLMILIVGNAIGCSGKDKKDSKNTLVVYSLYNDRTVADLINSYRNKNIKIEYKIGITESEDGRSSTEEEAIKLLNTEMMSGNSPDIIILDNLNTDNYVKKDLLDDIKDVISKNKEDIFENVFKLYDTDGKIYSFPLRMDIPIISGKELDTNIKDLKSLEEAVINSNNGKLFDVYTSKEMAALLYNSCEKSWINDDNSINEDKLKEFLECSKSIYQVVSKRISDEDRSAHDIEINSYNKIFDKDGYVKEYYLTSSDNYYDNFIGDSSKFAIGTINSYRSKVVLESINSKYNVQYSSWEGQNGVFFLPKLEVGICSNSKNKKNAKELIEYVLFNEDSQYELSGISTNKNICLNSLKYFTEETLGTMSVTDHNNVQYELSLAAIDESKINEFISSVDKLQLSSKVSYSMYDKVIDYMSDYIDNKSPIDKTLKNIKDKLELYLQEK